MLRSMTGFATAGGAAGSWSWTWDLRSVNGRGLDLRLRLPDWIEGLEPAVRAAFKGAAERGNVTLSLRLTRADAADTPVLNQAGLHRAIELLRTAEDAAAEGDLAVRHSTAAELLAVRGVLETGSGEAEDTGALRTALLDSLAVVIADWQEMRGAEGRKLATIVAGQLDRIETLVGEATALEPERQEKARSALTDALARVMDGATGADPDRVAQELALISVKSDVTEEIDRLTAHVAAARELASAEGAKGRKFDFLTQEFNREANTLCSKSQFAPLTRIGLELKTVIDQMREQVQNVE